MAKILVRVWQEKDIDEVREHLLIAGDPIGDCAHCKEIGINVREAKQCPNCKMTFTYIATRLRNDPAQAKKLIAKRPDLTAIDLADYKEGLGRKNARSFLMD